MIFIFLGLLIALYVVTRFAPLKYAAHAARASGLPNCAVPVSRWLTAGLAFDEAGQRVDTRGKFLGCVAGASMEPYGLPAGATFIAEPLHAPTGDDVKAGDIVVIDAQAQYSPVGFRLRKVQAVNGEMVSFEPDRGGREHNDRALTEVAARVIYVVP